MNALRVGTLGTRSAVLVSVMFRSLYGEESAELSVADPKAWGLDKVCVSAQYFPVSCVSGRIESMYIIGGSSSCRAIFPPSQAGAGFILGPTMQTPFAQADLGGMTCKLLVGLTAHGAPAATRTFAAALHDSDPEFDSELLHAAAAGEGGECLCGRVLESLSRALEEDVKERRKAEEQAAAAATGGGRGGVGDPFEGVPAVAESVDANEVVRQYGDAMTDLVHTQVTISCA